MSSITPVVYNQVKQLDLTNQLAKLNDENKEQLKNIQASLTEIKALMNEYVKIEQLNGLIDDIKASMEFILTTTPRNTDEITQLKNDILSIRTEMDDLRYGQLEEAIPAPQVKKKIPTLTIQKIKKT
jgi:chromosome segregation ATPase